jgi:hypothetical protein
VLKGLATRRAARAVVACRNATSSFFLNSSYDCPEPVLANIRCLLVVYITAVKRRRHTVGWGVCPRKPCGADATGAHRENTPVPRAGLKHNTRQRSFLSSSPSLCLFRACLGKLSLSVYSEPVLANDLSFFKGDFGNNTRQGQENFEVISFVRSQVPAECSFQWARQATPRRASPLVHSPGPSPGHSCRPPRHPPAAGTTWRHPISHFSWQS